MRAFFAAIIVLIILAFTFTTLPSDFAKLLAGQTLTGSILKTVREKTFGKNPAETRSDIIDRIEETIQELEYEVERLSVGKTRTATSSSAIKSKERAPEELIREAEDLLEELRSHNAEESGLLRGAAERAINNIFPAQNCPQACPVRSQQ